LLLFVCFYLLFYTLSNWKCVIYIEASRGSASTIHKNSGNSIIVIPHVCLLLVVAACCYFVKLLLVVIPHVCLLFTGEFDEHLMAGHCNPSAMVSWQDHCTELPWSTLRSMREAARRIYLRTCPLWQLVFPPPDISTHVSPWPHRARTNKNCWRAT
jgi:hypothetical protein